MVRDRAAEAGQLEHLGGAEAGPGRWRRRPAEWQEFDRPAGSTTKWSGLTEPETTASPRPSAASITVSARRPVKGFAVKRTPAVVAGTIRCTTTANSTVRWSMRLAAR